MNTAANVVEAHGAKKEIEYIIKYKEWNALNFSNGASAHSCPHCGAHQTWEGFSRPDAPKKTTKNLAKIIVLSTLVCGIIGMLAGLFIMIFTDTIALVIGAAVGVVLGVLIGFGFWRSFSAADLASYSDRYKAYGKELGEYEAYEVSLKTRTERHEPQFDEDCFQKAELSRYDDMTEKEWAGFRKTV